MPLVQEDEIQQESDTRQNASLQAAAARTLTRSMALYFSRPVRLFRPSKITGWQSLRSLAEHQGAVFDHKFLISLAKLQGFSVFSRHFFPPIAVNALLGTVLWTAYTDTYSIIEPSFQGHPIIGAAISGGVAGGIQALLAAPVENVRLVIEGGTSGHTWIQAWRSMIRDTPSASQNSRVTQLRDAREFRNWMKEVGEMAGRGWSGWGWGVAKDICAFSAFFAIFEVTRRGGQVVKAHSEELIAYVDQSEIRSGRVRQQIPRILNSFLLVSGGVLAGLVYEIICRPWDKARRVIYLSRVHSTEQNFFKPVYDAIQAEGPIAFLRNSNYEPSTGSGFRSKVKSLIRTLGRVGPWGIGFLVWEMYGPGLT